MILVLMGYLVLDVLNDFLEKKLINLDMKKIFLLFQLFLMNSLMWAGECRINVDKLRLTELEVQDFIFGQSTVSSCTGNLVLYKVSEQEFVVVECVDLKLIGKEVCVIDQPYRDRRFDKLPRFSPPNRLFRWLTS